MPTDRERLLLMRQTGQTPTPLAPAVGATPAGIAPAGTVPGQPGRTPGRPGFILQ